MRVTRNRGAELPFETAESAKAGLPQLRVGRALEHVDYHLERKAEMQQVDVPGDSKKENCLGHRRRP